MLNFKVLNLRKWKRWHIRSLLTELIHGLTDIIKDQITQSKLNQGATGPQIQDLTKVVNDFANTSPAASTTTERPKILRLPQVNLSSFNGQPDDDLERFLEQSTILLISSGVPSRYYITWLKNNIKILLHTNHNSSPSHKAYLDYLNAIKETLIQKRGKPKDDKNLWTVTWILYYGSRSRPNCISICTPFSWNSTFFGKTYTKHPLHFRQKNTELQHAFFLANSDHTLQSSILLFFYFPETLYGC